MQKHSTREHTLDIGPHLGWIILRQGPMRLTMLPRQPVGKSMKRQPRSSVLAAQNHFQPTTYSIKAETVAERMARYPPCICVAIRTLVSGPVQEGNHSLLTSRVCLAGPSLTYELDGPLFAPEVYSKGSLGWARELLAECDQEHERCNKARRRNAREKFIPTRLIDVNFTRDMVRARLAGRPGLVRGNRSWLRELAPTASEIQGSDMVLGFGRWQAGILEQGENQISQGLDGLPSKSIAMPQGLAFRLGMHWWTKKIKATAWSVAPESAVRAS